MKMKIGEKVQPHLVPLAGADDPDVIHGPGWLARRTSSGAILDYQTAGHGTHDDAVVLTAAEFEELRADPAKLDAILQRHGQ